MLRYVIGLGFVAMFAVALGCGGGEEGRTGAEKAEKPTNVSGGKQEGLAGPKPRFTPSSLKEAGAAQDANK